MNEEEREDKIVQAANDLSAYINAERHLYGGALIGTAFLTPLALMALMGTVRGTPILDEFMSTTITGWLMLVIGVAAVIYAVAAFFRARDLKPAYQEAETWIMVQVQQELEDNGIIKKASEQEETTVGCQ